MRLSRLKIIMIAALKADEQRPSCDLCGKIIGLDTSSFGTPEETAADPEALHITMTRMCKSTRAESHCSDHTSSAAPRRPPSGTSILCWLNISRLTHQRLKIFHVAPVSPRFFLGGPSSLAGHGPTRFARRWPTPAAFLCPVRFQIRLARPLQRVAGRNPRPVGV